MATAITAGLCAFLALTLLTVWSRRSRERRQEMRLTRRAVAAVPEPPAAPASTPLDEMINDTLPLVEEAPTFPPNLAFHGRTIGFRYLLVSGPHGLRGPHFSAGQVSSRLRHHAGAGGAQAASRPIRPKQSEMPHGDVDEDRSDGERAAVADVVPSGVEDPTPARTGRQPSPLERALLARRGRKHS